MSSLRYLGTGENEILRCKIRRINYIGANSEPPGRANDTVLVPSKENCDDR